MMEIIFSEFFLNEEKTNVVVKMEKNVKNGKNVKQSILNNKF